MSIRVDIAKLEPELQRYGSAAFVLTSSGEGRPHVMQLRVRLVEGQILATPGRSCAANVTERPELSLLWPAFEDNGYSLIVDGTGLVVANEDVDSDEITLVVTPTSGVLHRPA